MILVNGLEARFDIFPNGETKVVPESFEDNLSKVKNRIKFKYESDSDLVKLMFLKMHLDSRNLSSELLIYYMPYSRMDRVEGNSVFTLKYVSNFINMLEFTKVTVIEPHSDVTPALLHRSYPYYINFDLLPKVEKQVGFNKDIDFLFFPDAGAQKRYQSLKGYRQLVGYKNRDFQTGEITSLDVVGNLPEHNTLRKVIIVDDLSSYGTTFLHSAYKLKELGFYEIYLLVAHCENSIFGGQLLKDDSPIEKIFTTDSIVDDVFGAKKLKIYPLEDILI